VDRDRRQNLMFWTELILVGMAVTIGLVAGSVTIHLPVGGFNDDAVYVALGRAISTGAGYRSIYLVGAPLHVKYPPLFPALLALCWRIGGTLEVVKALAVGINLAACGAAAAMLWWLARVRLGIPVALIATATIVGFLLDPSVQYFTMVLSEPLYILGWASVLVLYERWRSGAVDTRRRTALAIGLTLAACALTREEGIVLIPAVLLVFALDGAGRREWWLAAAGAVVPIALWNGGLALATRHEALAGQGSEGAYLRFFLSGPPTAVVPRELRVEELSVQGYDTILSTLLSGSPIIGKIATAIFVLAFVWGAFLLRRRARALGLSALATLAVILSWPALQDRFLVPLLPFAAVVAAYGLHSAVQFLFSGLTARRLTGGAVALCAALVLVRQETIRDDAGRARAERRAPRVMTPSAWMPGNAGFVVSLAQWATASTRPDDRIAVASAAGLWLYSGRATELTEFSEPEDAPSVFDVAGRYLAGLLAARRVTVVVVESPDAPIARDVMAVRGRCPRSLSPMPGFPGRATPEFFRAMPDSACIAALRDSLAGVEIK
jgi:hypothetical protein